MISSLAPAALDTPGRQWPRDPSNEKTAAFLCVQKFNSEFGIESSSKAVSNEVSKIFAGQWEIITFPAMQA
jgi:hypothetical protein